MVKNVKNSVTNMELEKMAARTIKRDYKARMFSMLYHDKKELLDLYNALNQSHYDDPNKLEINTLENAIYLSMQNDVSFIIDSRLSLYEHQSTYSPNLPLRYLLYVSDLYSKITKDANLYGTKLVKIPPPKFLIFYNGIDKRPEMEEMRLSDAYMIEEPAPSLELRAVMLNINPGNNEALLSTCKTLRDYVEYTSRVRLYAKTLPIEDAVEKAITECIKEGILAEFLMKSKAEAKAMSIYEYDEERQRQFDREEGRSDMILAMAGICKSTGLSLEDTIAEIAEASGVDVKRIREDIQELWTKDKLMVRELSPRQNTISLYEYDEEKQRQFDREEGREEARAEMIAVIVDLCREMEVSLEETITRIAEKCGEDPEKIREEIKEFWQD